MSGRRGERLLFVFWCVVCLVAAEFVSRRIVPLEPVPRWKGLHVPDSAAAYRLAPNLDGRIYFFGDVHIRTNHLGLRDREYGPRAPGVRRVLMIGDSQTLGLVDEHETFPRQLERELEKDGGRWEVINAGVLGYGTEQELLRLRWLLPIYRPDVVVLTVFANDAYDNRFPPNERWTVDAEGLLHSRTEKPVPPPPIRHGLVGVCDWLSRRVNLFAMGVRATDRLFHFARRDGPARPVVLPEASPLLARSWTHEDARAWARTDSLLGEVAAAARAGGARIVFVDGASRAAVSWIMWPADVDTTRYDLDRETVLLDSAAAHAGAPCLHVLPAFRAARSTEELFFPGDDHWTGRGNALAAATVAPAVRALVH